MKRVLTVLALALTAGAMVTAMASAMIGVATAQERPPVPPWSEEPPPRVPAKPGWTPRVDLRWDKYYTLDEMHAALREVAAAFPELVTLRSIGTSVEGRDLLLAVVNDAASGADTEKPAFWCDGNIHGNEVQAGEACLYTIWWLCENRELPRVKRLLAERSLYILCSLNPDGRAHWFDAPNTMHSSRGGKRPVDNDRDGRFDEDPPNDLDGDGELLQMRVADPNGTHKSHPDEPRLLVRVKPGERGQWRLLGSEGIDDDGDGRINEDGPGGYDPNRDWPSDWRGPAEQRGAGPYPASLPETQAVIEFLVAHPNVAGVQSFHNTGGMILRGPGSKTFGNYPARDEQVMRALAERGEQQLPSYRSMVIWKDLYTVYGGEVNFTYEMLGITSFTNELWSRDLYFQRDPKSGDEGRIERLRWDDEVELGARFVAWKSFDHPQLGPIELGGWRKQTGRVPPPFLLQNTLHRNMAFVLYHADQMPLVAPGTATVNALGDGLFEIDAVFRNERMIPTRTQRAEQKRIGAPDRARVAGSGIEVLSGGQVNGRTNRVDAPQMRRPADLRLPRGIHGDGAVRLRWVVRGTGQVTITYTAEKGGTATLTADVK